MVKENFIQETRLYIDSILKEAKEIDQEINAIKILIEEIETKLTNNKVNNI